MDQREQKHAKIKIKLKSFKSSEYNNEKKGMCDTAVSATQASSVTIWQHGAKQNNCNFVTFNRVVDTKNYYYPSGPTTLNFV